MTFLNTFKTPYLDADTGTELSGTNSTQQTDTQQLDTNQVGGEQQTAQEQMFKLKYNHEEREIPYSQAVELAQKGMNYDKAIERARQEALETDPRISFVASQAKKYNMTPEQYLEAVKKSEEHSQLQELVQKNIPEEYAKEMLENRKFREQYQTKEETEKQKEQAVKDYTSFSDWFTKTKGKEPVLNEIPVEVWQAVDKGASLKNAYMEYDYNILHGQLQKGEQALQTQQANEKNASTSTGSASSKGPTNASALTEEMIANMSPSELAKRWPEVRKLYKMQ